MKVDNSDLIDAVAWLKSERIIKRDVEIADKLDYSKGNLSSYMNNKKEAPEIFMIKFRAAYPELSKRKQSSTDRVEEPVVTYGRLIDAHEETIKALKGENKAQSKYIAVLEDKLGIK